MSSETNGNGASPDLYAKLVEVARKVSHVEKDGTNTFQKYKYTSAEAMLTALRGPLADQNVTLLEAVEGIDDREYTTTGGKASVVTTAHMSFTFVDGDTGQMHRCLWAGRGDDAADKGLGKAYTNAVKTFLRAQFLIPQGDDPEADAQTDQRAADRAPTPKATAANDPAVTTLRQLANDAVKAKVITRAEVKLLLTANGATDASDIATLPPEGVQAVGNHLLDLMPAETSA